MNALPPLSRRSIDFVSPGSGANWGRIALFAGNVDEHECWGAVRDLPKADKPTPVGLILRNASFYSVAVDDGAELLAEWTRQAGDLA